MEKKKKLEKSTCRRETDVTSAKFKEWFRSNVDLIKSGKPGVIKL